MRTIVITGGTDGIGRALAATLLRRGDRVVVVGRNADKGRAYLDAARRDGAGGRASFIQAELSLVSENEMVLARLRERFDALDVLVLGARHYRSVRRETTEGFEGNFALFYLSRFLLSHGLVDLLEKGANPAIVNIAGPGADLSVVRWDDLELRRGYHGGAALGQGGKLNDLLGVAFAGAYPDGRTRYVLVHPGVVSTSFSGAYDEATASQVEALKKVGKPVDESVRQILPPLDAPPPEPLSAFVEGRRISLDDGSFDRAAASRLDALTHRLLARPRPSSIP
ncbi:MULTISPECIES: SDR family NAD(P)-dependent oxidoreductase [unclassified Pseudofrankia]|uniref:SDR family NAD(P)-dependent oxidoreductase n=1 Tax=unclassified Pseudofrankia TaxID=2994372 RepID=UPI0008DAE298|nr:MULTISPECIES: SDR family NAD(P)-dependent oxidoreductase [unclassified Pseudofrankia]MDT3441036.1 SDR family NAD(P)-dependent oxidoreductase [Pseudofrankia sp. BMG5.37]OHV42547.1 oxidoreductase [Pseudofrankia sp. BMG5.36]